MIQVYCYSRCSTCRKALKWMDEKGLAYTVRDIQEDHPDEETLRACHKKTGLPLRKLFNTSGKQYRELGLSQKLKTMSEEDQYALLASDGMLVKRPFLISQDLVLVGFHEEEWAGALLSGREPADA